MLLHLYSKIRKENIAFNNILFFRSVSTRFEWFDFHISQYYIIMRHIAITLKNKVVRYEKNSFLYFAKLQ